MNAGRVAWAIAKDFEGYARAAHPDLTDLARHALAERLAQALSRVPNVVEQMQWTDWPVCRCGDALTDYLGHPRNRASFANFVAEGARRYELGALGADGDIERLAEGDPETWEDVCCFACARCDARYFTDQYT